MVFSNWHLGDNFFFLLVQFQHATPQQKGDQQKATLKYCPTVSCRCDERRTWQRNLSFPVRGMTTVSSPSACPQQRLDASHLGPIL